jgi:pimeloyl-ACP methyl ester carboxylesterase
LANNFEQNPSALDLHTAQENNAMLSSPRRLVSELGGLLPPRSSLTVANGVELVRLLLQPLLFCLTLPFLLVSGWVRWNLMGGKAEGARLAASLPARVAARLEVMNREAALPAASPAVSTSTRSAPSAKEAQGFQSQFVESADGTALHVVAGGNFASLDKPILLFVHGFPECWSTWQSQLTYFAKLGFPVAAMDLRGFGLSNAPLGGGVSDAYCARVLADDVLRVVHKLRLQSALGAEKAEVVLVAHDWGGVIGWHVAFEGATPHATGPLVPDARAIKKIVLCSAPHPGHFIPYALKRDRFQLLRSWYMLWFQVPYLPELWMYSAPDRFAKSLSSTDPELLPASISDPSTCRGMLSYYRAAAREQLPRWLGGPPPTRRARAPLAVQVPVLQICGRNDVALGKVCSRNCPSNDGRPTRALASSCSMPLIGSCMTNPRKSTKRCSDSCKRNERST